ncbi:MAG: AMP-binding protein, partial [Gammaproteobacteria bacterium]
AAVADAGFHAEFAVCLDGDADWKEWVGDVSAPPTDVELDAANDLLAIIYTSGTTGNPKGAMLTHANLAANTWSTSRALQLRPLEDRVLVVLPMFHSFAATVGMLSSLLFGVSFIPVPKFDPELVVSSIERHGASLFLGVPSMYNVLLRLPEGANDRLKSLRLCVSGGAAMPVEILRRFEERYGVGVHEGDGPTECSPVTCINPVDGERKPGTVGPPVPLVEMRICDEHGKTLPDGEVGEICVRGPNIMKGYWNLPEATEESFFDDWFRTGDLGTRDADGYFSIVDRLKDMIIVNGMNVYPRMVEEVLYAHESIREAAVVGEAHESHGEIPVAYVAAVEGQTLDEKGLRIFCKERLGAHQMPRRFVILDDLPKNATGKIMKRELRREGELERGIDIKR